MLQTLRHSTQYQGLLLAILLVASLAGTRASAQVNSNAASVALNAVLGETLSVSATPATVNFTLVPGSTANGSAPVVVTTSWVLSPSRAALGMYAWFATPAAALTDGAATPDNIPAQKSTPARRTESPPH